MSGMGPRGLLALALAAASLVASPAAAVDLGDKDDPASVEVHAFASQGYLLSKDNNYIDTGSSHGTLQFSEIGINFTKTLGDRLRFGVQLDAQDLGTTGNYNAKADWFYADYRFTDWLGLRFVRV